MGRELRLKQEYFFVSASLQDILQSFLADSPSFEHFPDKVAIQLNDTHPAIAIPELMRLFIDVHGLDWDQAWTLTRRTFGYTNHTLMPEALETWPVSLLEQMLPRHLGLIYQINERFLADVRRHFPGDVDRVRRLSLVDEEGDSRVRMAHLALVGSHRVNGVSRLHTELLKTTIFAEFEALYPQRIVNITNGVTPRRWLRQANGSLASLITEQIGDGWTSDLSQLARLKPLAVDREFQQRFLTVKLGQKTALAEVIKIRLGIEIDPASMFDIQIKRIHEYKRQLLNVLRVIGRYNRIRAGDTELVPRTVIFSGKAAPGYAAAKHIIHLIHAVAEVINRDPVASKVLKVVFVPNYSVSTAERIIPACELSEQISIAGSEASGTGNMKCAINGAITIGTLDGANVEMREEVGPENIFIFGMTAEEVVARRVRGYNPWEIYGTDPEIRQTLDMIGEGFFLPDDPKHFLPIVDSLTLHGDHFMVLADYAGYVRCQDDVDALYRNPHEWARRAILNLAGMGYFSSDRTVTEYADKIWNLHPISAEPQSLAEPASSPVPVPVRTAVRRRGSA
jgi:starch phosphorylase